MSVPATTKAGTSTWAIDPAHSAVEFSVKHMMVATVKGRFTGLAGTVHLDEANPANSSVEATVDLSTVSTGNEQRDGHLRTDDFFNSEQFKQATFRSTRIEVVDSENAKVYGTLTIRDVTKDVVLDTEFEGQGKDAYGKQRAGFTAQTTINRLDYGVKWNPALETGGVAVSNRVKLIVHVAAVRQD